ncbi:MAG: membrane protein insertion efficiency factor YidD, partial [Bacteroidaceae bacterium]|nr:membrane protein insertion efficiency factor YidD [Bacteroidaceae bacterium]
MKRSFLQSAMLKSVDFYRRSISPYKGGPTCNFVPTCSQYA